MYRLTETPDFIADADNTYIPTDPANRDYQAYLKWIEAGNTAGDAIEPEISYRQLRAIDYPPIGDQLDMLWHAIDTGAPLDTSSAFYLALKAVKDAYPKE